MRRLPGDEADQQARYLEAEVEGLTVASVYLPNGVDRKYRGADKASDHAPVWITLAD